MIFFLNNKIKNKNKKREKKNKIVLKYDKNDKFNQNKIKKKEKKREKKEKNLKAIIIEMRASCMHKGRGQLGLFKIHLANQLGCFWIICFILFNFSQCFAWPFSTILDYLFNFK